MSEMIRPGASVAAVTPSDSTDIAKLNGHYPRALWVGGTGNVVIVTPDGEAATLANVADGTLLPIQARRVNSTSTTATSIVAIY
jgi:hypothetical protein